MVEQTTARNVTLVETNGVRSYLSEYDSGAGRDRYHQDFLNWSARDRSVSVFSLSAPLAKRELGLVPIAQNQVCAYMIARLDEA